MTNIYFVTIYLIEKFLNHYLLLSHGIKVLKRILCVGLHRFYNCK